MHAVKGLSPALWLEQHSGPGGFMRSTGSHSVCSPSRWPIKKNTIKLWTPRGQELGCIHTDLEQVPYNPVDLLAEINIHAFWVLLPMISGVPENEGKFCSTTPNTYQFTLVLHYFSQLPLLFGFTNHLSKSLNSKQSTLMPILSLRCSNQLHDIEKAKVLFTFQDEEATA